MIRICLEVKEREEDGYKDGKYHIYKKIFSYANKYLSKHFCLY